MVATPDEIERALAAVSASRIADRLEALAAIGPDPDGGISRLGLTAEEQRARDLVRSWLAPLGYQCSQDDAANLHCRAGDEPRVLVGSHLDTVPRGGRYDGALGVVAAAEVAEALHHAGVALPLHVVAWTGEEGVRFGTGLFGSAAACGLLEAEDWERRDATGRTARQAAAELLGRPVHPESVPMRRDSVRACLELHIEQSSGLERRGRQLGVVSAIVGLHHGMVTVTGRADHAGTTPMGQRQDALAAAAECILAVEEVSAVFDAAIATVGEIEVLPAAKNVVPGSCTFSLDVRSATDGRRGDALAAILAGIERICERRGVGWRVETVGESPAALMDERVAGADDAAQGAKALLLACTIASG